MRDGRSADGLGYVVCEPRQLRPALCFPRQRDWFGSLGPGVVNARPAAWVLFGNLWFPADAAGHEGNPSVPPGKVLITLGDWPVVRPYDRWRRVRQLVFHGARRRNEWSHGMSASAAERSPHRPFRLRAESDERPIEGSRSSPLPAATPVLERDRLHVATLVRTRPHP